MSELCPCRNCKEANMEEIYYNEDISVKGVDLHVEGLLHWACPNCNAAIETAAQIDHNGSIIQKTCLENLQQSVETYRWECLLSVLESSKEHMKDIYKTKTLFQLRNELAVFEGRLESVRQKKQEIDNSSHGISLSYNNEEKRIAEHIAFLKKLIEERK